MSGLVDSAAKGLELGAGLEFQTGLGGPGLDNNPVVPGGSLVWGGATSVLVWGGNDLVWS